MEPGSLRLPGRDGGRVPAHDARWFATIEGGLAWDLAGAEFKVCVGASVSATRRVAGRLSGLRCHAATRDQARTAAMPAGSLTRWTSNVPSADLAYLTAANVGEWVVSEGRVTPFPHAWTWTKTSGCGSRECS